MPTYDYRCQDCQRRFSTFLTFAEYGNKKVVCPHCKSERVQRKIGKVRVARGSGFNMDDMTNPANLEGMEDDPRALGRMMRQMSEQTGEELPPEFDDVVGRLEKGQSPEEIERELPDLGTESPLTGEDFSED
jgi:putative FmdB family regulatory protein